MLKVNFNLRDSQRKLLVQEGVLLLMLKVDFNLRDSQRKLLVHGRGVAADA